MSSSTPVAGEELQAARQLLAEVLDMEATEIADDAGFGDLASWDSLAHMRLIMAMEAQMSAQLSPGNVVALGSLLDIATVLEGGELSATGF